MQSDGASAGLMSFAFREFGDGLPEGVGEQFGGPLILLGVVGVFEGVLVGVRVGVVVAVFVGVLLGV